MAQIVSTDCLYTTVKNVSGKTRVFGFLGLRGMRLAADEVVTIRGNIVTTLGGKNSARKFQALERALTGDDGARDPSLAILSTPAVFLFDGDDTKQLALQGGVLGLVDPCWDAAGSSVFAGVDT